MKKTDLHLLEKVAPDAAWYLKSSYEKYGETWERAISVADYRNILMDEDFNSHICYQANKSNYEYKERLLEGKTRYLAFADRGGLVIKNELCEMLIPNGGGDGSFWVYVFEDPETNTDLFQYFTSIKGKFNLMQDDVVYEDTEVLTTLEGEYEIYIGNYKIIFKERRTK